MQVIRSKSSAKAADMRFFILVLQVIVVAVILVFAIVIRAVGGDIYDNLSTWYREKFNDITTVDEVLDVEESKQDGTYEDSVPEAALSEEESFEDDLFADELLNDEIETSVSGYLTEQQTLTAKPVSTTNVNSIIWPVNGRITSEYGYRVHPITGAYSMHGGIDISAVKGTPIFSAYDGKISKVGYSNSYGHYVIIEHSGNLSTLYAHCSKVISKEGDVVNKGDKVALVGNTGRSTGSHLHFEVRIGGCRVNPRWLLPEVTDV